VTRLAQGRISHVLPAVHLQLLHGDNEGVYRRRVHEIKVDDVVDAHRFEGQNHVAKICSLDFRDGGGKHLVFVRIFGVQTIAFPWARAPSTPLALVCKPHVIT
jgi:hypothetical protein